VICETCNSPSTGPIPTNAPNSTVSTRNDRLVRPEEPIELLEEPNVRLHRRHQRARIERDDGRSGGATVG